MHREKPPLDGELLSVIDVSKRFPGVVALDHVSFELKRGEVHVLFGENGAGKSTLVNVIAGTYLPDSGEIKLEGRLVRFRSPHDARAAGVNAVFQEFSLVPTLSVKDNILLGRERRRAGFLDKREMGKQATESLHALGFDISADARVDALGRAQQQMVEIAKALQGKPILLVLDEPTASLTENESRVLFRLLDRLKSQGLGIIYITHKMREIWEVADRITVLRDGRGVATISARDAREDQLIALMTGRELTTLYPVIQMKPGRVRLEVHDLSTRSGLKSVSMNARAGEVVGIAGLIGSGKSDLARACFGVEAVTSGQIAIDGMVVTRPTPTRMLARGLVYLPSDRRTEGLVLTRSVRENLSLSALQTGRLSVGPVLRRKQERVLVSDIIRQLRVRPAAPERRVALLSGGNQQKVMFGRGMVRHMKVFLFDEPTTGVDVGARTEIYGLINQLAEGGAAIVVVSSDLPEILNLSHRVYIITRGRVVGEMERSELNETTVLEKFFADPSDFMPGGRAVM